jgi:capsular exopolysaccharide synthesis family protein
MENNNNNYPQPNPPAFEEEESSFDFMKWLILIAHYWYLFVISISIALTLAYLSNRKWNPIYKVGAKVIIEESSNKQMGAQSVMQGFGVQEGYKNVNNQIIMFSSTTLIKKVLNRIPLDIDYYTRGRFKIHNLYKIAPILIKYDYLSEVVYPIEFHFHSIDEYSYKISFEGNKEMPGFTLTGKYGVPLQCSMFFITVNKTEFFQKKANLFFRFHSKDDLANEYSNRLALDFVMKGSSVVQISLVGDNDQRDEDFLNALCEEFLTDDLARKNDVASKTIDFIDAQLMKIADSLSIAAGHLREYQTKNNIIEIGSYSSNLIAKSTTLDKQRVDLNLKKSYLDYLSNYLKGNIQDGKIVAPSSLGITDPLLLTAVADFSEMQRKRNEMGVGSPYYKKYQTQLEIKKQALFEMLKNVHEDFNIEVKNFEIENNKLQKNLGLLPNQENTILNFQRVYNLHDNYYTYLMQKRAESQIQKASNSSDNIILDKAQLITVTNGGEKQKRYSLNFLFGLLLPLVFIVLKEYLNTTIRNKKDISKYTRYDFIGSVRRANIEAPVLVLRRPKSLFAENFRLIRNRLEFIIRARKTQNGISVLVTSCQSGDGKSYFCVNLAGIYSMEGKKTILIDLDLRKPSIANALSIKKHRGLSNYLIDQATLDDIIVKDTKYPFDIILSGTLPPNPGELIKNQKLKDLLETLKQTYDCIVIDTSPIGLVGDAYALTHLVDANLFVVRQDKTNKLFFKTVIEQIKQDNVPNLYIVLNDVNFNKTESAGYLGYIRNSYAVLEEEAYYSDLESDSQI